MSVTHSLSPQQKLAERIKFVAPAILLVFVVGWIAWFYPFDDLLDRSGRPLGADYAMFYVAGKATLEGAGERLYDQAWHQARLQEQFPGIDPEFALPYRYPPFVSLLMAPLAALPYAASFAVFAAASCLAWFVSARLLLRELPQLEAWRWTLVWAIVGWPVALETIIGGQASMLALLIAVAAYVQLKRERYVVGGAVLALAAYKPNVLALFALGCLLRYPRAWRGFIPVALLVGGLSLVRGGWEAHNGYIHLATNLTAETWNVATPYWKVHGLASLFEAASPDSGRLLCVACGALLTMLVALRWSRLEPESPASSLCVAALISINALFNPYTPIYDLTLLLVGALLTVHFLAATAGVSSQRGMLVAQLALTSLYFGPHLSQSMAKSAGYQPFALALVAATVWLLWKLYRPGDRTDEGRAGLLTPAIGGNS